MVKPIHLMSRYDLLAELAAAGITPGPQDNNMTKLRALVGKHRARVEVEKSMTSLGQLSEKLGIPGWEQANTLPARTRLLHDWLFAWLKEEGFLRNTSIRSFTGTRGRNVRIVGRFSLDCVYIADCVPKKGYPHTEKMKLMAVFTRLAYHFDYRSAGTVPQIIIAWEAANEEP